MLTAFQVLVGLRNFGEREDAVHDAVQLACFDQLHDADEVAARLAAALGVTIVDLLSRAPESASEGLL